MDEHIEETIKFYLGRRYKEITPKNQKVAELREEFIKAISERCRNDEKRAQNES
jgi:hypothetical protein